MHTAITKLCTSGQRSVEKLELERVCMSDEQNDELCELVKAISSSDQGHKASGG